MRDIAFTLVFMAAWISCFVRPYMGPLVWAWVSMMYPQRLMFGFAQGMPVAAIAGATTLIMFAVSREKSPFPRNAPAILMVIFFAWSCVSSLMTINSPDLVFELWVKVAKIQIMLFVTMMMLSGRQQINWLVWVVALSVGFYGFKGGIFTLLTGGRSSVLGPPGSFIAPNNELGVALVMVFPLLYYLFSISRNKWVRPALLAGTLLNLVAILGTYSRAAFLAAATMAFFMGMKSQRKIFTLVVTAVVLVGMLTFLPEKWTDRMQSISTHQDDSSQSRLQTWQLIWDLALDHPLTGGGYRITENEAIWDKYAKEPYARALAPHSIYFQALAEHGFVGLFLFLFIGAATWRLASKTARLARDGPEADWVPQLMGMIQVSMIGFAIAGAFNALANYDLPYYLAAIVAMVARDVQAGRVPAVKARGAALAGAMR